MKLWLALLAFGTLFLLFLRLSSPPNLQLVACDVGQGDAILIRYGQSVVLIDSGRNSAVLRCLSRELSWWDPTIDVYIATHPDADHVGGTMEVAKRYRIKSWWYVPSEKQTQLVAQLNELPRQLGEPIEPILGDLLRAPGFRTRVVWSDATAHLWYQAKLPDDDSNARSIGVQIEAKSFGFLSLGDLACEQELAVTTLSLLTTTTILKASHHGAKTSSCPEFQAKVRPEMLFISVGEGNSYGHPGEDVLATAAQLREMIYRTDQMGDIRFSLDRVGQLYRHL